MILCRAFLKMLILRFWIQFPVLIACPFFFNPSKTLIDFTSPTKERVTEKRQFLLMASVKSEMYSNSARCPSLSTSFEVSTSGLLFARVEVNWIFYFRSGRRELDSVFNKVFISFVRSKTKLFNLQIMYSDIYLSCFFNCLCDNLHVLNFIRLLRFKFLVNTVTRVQ